jgi:hypothetical protein
MGAVITKSGQTLLLAGYTRVNLSAQDSFQTVATDGVQKIRRWLWSISDGFTANGAHTSWKPIAGPTQITYTVVLTCEFKDGSPSSTAQTTITVAPTPSFAAFTKYVSASTGSDAGGQFDGNSPAFPYKTLQKARDVWTSFRGGSSTGFAPGQILLKNGDTFPATGAASFDFGPVFIGTYGAGSAPIVSLSAGSEFALGFTNHDNLYDNPVWSSGINYVYATENSNNLFGMGHVATQLENSVVTNAGIFFTGAGSSLYGVTQSKGWRYGCFPSSTFLSITNSSFAGSGHDSVFDHQIYASNGVDHCGFVNVTTDGAGAAGAADGFKTSGCEKLYLGDCTAKNSTTAFDVGGNNDPEECLDLVYDRPTSINCVQTGFFPDNCDRVSIRNPRSFGGLATSVIDMLNYDHGSNNIEVLDGSFSNFTGRFFRTNNSNFAGAIIEDVAAKKANAGVFYDIPLLSDLSKITARNNQYFRDGGDSTGFAIVAGVTISFSQWQTAPYNMDAGSHFGDPLFVDPASDLHLQTASPCIDAGMDTGIAFDYDGTQRPQGGSYDVGAYESTISSGGKYTFRQQAQTFQVGTTEIGFESQAAADAGVRQAIADNPICGLNGLAWVYPGTNNALPNHLFVRRFNRWERGNSPSILLWFIQAGQDDGTEAHETGIPGYATAQGYDATLQAIMDRYATDVGDPTISSKTSHYEIVWRKKQKAAGVPPQPDPIVITVIIPGPMTATVYGGTNFVPLNPIWCETDTTVVATSGTGNIPVPPIWCETSTTTMTVNYGSTVFYVNVKKIYSNYRIFQNMSIRSPSGDGDFALDMIFCDAVLLQMDFTIEGGDQGITPQSIFCESDVSVMDSHVSSTTTAVPLQPIWCEQGAFDVMAYLQVSTLTFVPLSRIYCESAALGPIFNAGGNLHVALQAIWCESFLQAMSLTNNGAIGATLQAIWCETFLWEMTRTNVDPQTINLVAASCDAYILPMDAVTVATPQAVSSGELSGDVEFEEEF